MNSKRNKLEDLLNDESFVRWIRGRADDAEMEHWEQWIHEDAERYAIVEKAREFYKLPFSREKVSEETVRDELKSVHSLIDEHEKKRAVRDIRWLPKDDHPYYYLVAVAAAMALLIGVIALFQPKYAHRDKLAAYKTVTVPYGSKSVVRLADGSRITVNANSSLKYPANASIDSDVNIWINGEAYFSVTHNPDNSHRKFLINTADGLIRDLGTKFTVNTRDKATRVVLEEGRVQVELHDTLSHNTKRYDMHPGELTYFAAGLRNITVENVNPVVFTSWVHNKFVFDETPVNSVIRNIEEIYGVHIHITDSDILDQKISGSIKSYDLQVILKGLSKILNVKVIRNGSDISITSLQK